MKQKREITSREIIKLRDLIIPTGSFSTSSLATTAYVDSKVQNTIIPGIVNSAPSQDAVYNALLNKVDKNSPISGSTHTKITYDSKGLVTSGSNATTADIDDTLNRRYTRANK